jgi:hypothetical protein
MRDLGTRRYTPPLLIADIDEMAKASLIAAARPA